MAKSPQRPPNRELNRESSRQPNRQPWDRRPAAGPGGDRRGANPRPRQGGRPDDVASLFGFHAVAAALANPGRDIQRVMMTESAAQRVADALQHRGLEPEIVEPRDLDRRLGPDAVHQGLLIEAAFLREPELEALCAPEAAGRGAAGRGAAGRGAAGRGAGGRGAGGLTPLLLVLDQVTDPHNVGALLRSASVFGVSGLIMTRQHSPPLSGVLAKAASGALEHVPVALVTNLARTMEALADLGVHRIGLDGDASESLESSVIKGPTALVLGAEGRGLRRLTRENCDVLCRISTFGALKSLNVSNAAAVALHALRTCGPGRS
jgi:23S rRNA (guanosine2251-2'-O)-methyltransferase